MSVGRDQAAAMVAEVFASLGSEAVFRAAAGGEVNLRVVPRIVDVASTDPFAVTQQRGRVMSILTANVATRPVRGDEVEILPGGMAMPGVYPVMEEAVCEDVFQLVWVARVSEPG